MKVILSRKGFDSGCGGDASLILPNNEMITLPIPQKNDPYRYSEIYTRNGENLFNIMKSLKKTIRYDGDNHILTKNTRCHLDPDICEFSVKRDKNWKGIFGQGGIAEGHLRNNDVKEGDLFIFFGWFKDVEVEGKNYRFAKGGGRHTMFGYLQIDKILHPNYEKVPKEFKNHPHVYNAYRNSDDSNTIYIAKDVCTFDKRIKGYGMFKYDEKLDLTKKGMTKSRWELPRFFKGLDITFHTKDSFKKGYFQSVSKGQEFVIEENKEVEKWAKTIIREHSTNRV